MPDISSLSGIDPFTAEDVCTMNLIGTDLVVLSACKTGFAE